MPLHLFDGLGIELEYMIVDRETLEVRPICDQLFRAIAGRNESDIEFGELSASNELALHLLELKVNDPTMARADLSEKFAGAIQNLNQRLGAQNAMLLATAMHPFMNPVREMKLWPHEGHEIYATYDRIFDCRRHGFANLQSMHLNFPFCGEDEFVRLHAAIRVLLPLLPALAASSPFIEGKVSGVIDTRVSVYRDNQKKVPSIAGDLIPEDIHSITDYHARIFEKIDTDIRPFDPEGKLAHEWLNSRAAIARFDRDAIEIRLLDIQECPRMDLAIAEFVFETLRYLVETKKTSFDAQLSFSQDSLKDILFSTEKDADQALIDSPAYAELFEFPYTRPFQARTLLTHLLDRIHLSKSNREAIEMILSKGVLSRRILRATGEAPSLETLQKVYRELAQSLATNTPFSPTSLL